MNELEKAAAVAAIERDTGIYVAEVQEARMIEPVHGGTCAWCGDGIEMWYNAMWCDDCLDEWLALPLGFVAHPKEHFENRARTGWRRTA